MPRKARELKAVEVSRLASPGFHAVGGVAGLHLRISGTLARSWILRATVGGKRTDIGLGGFPDVPLAQARDKAREARRAIDSGVDPVARRREARLALRPTLTFDEAAVRLVATKAPEWKNGKHLAQWSATLQTYASPVLGSLPVDKIDVPHVLNALQSIWLTKTETASRVRARIEAVLSWATVSGFRDGANPARWKGNLDTLLPKPGKVRRVKHHDALPIDEVPSFLLHLQVRPGVAARALEFLVLTAARSGEVRGARWSEIDLVTRTWTIPAERMKAGKEHRVPLSDQACRVLQGLPKFAASEYVFQGPSGLPLSDMSISAVMRRMKIPAVPHGFRSTFRDWTSERTNFPSDVAEMALAHTIANKVEAAYRRGELFEKRRQMMSAWANFSRPSETTDPEE